MPEPEALDHAEIIHSTWTGNGYHGPASGWRVWTGSRYLPPYYSSRAVAERVLEAYRADAVRGFVPRIEEEVGDVASR